MTVEMLPSGHWRVTPRVRRGFLAEPPALVARAGEVQYYIAYTGIRPEVAEAAPLGTVWVDVSSHPEAYWEMLCEVWGRGRTCALLEHDILWRPDIGEAFETCAESPWCVFSYTDLCHDHCREAWANMLGCTRFRAELMAKVPDAVSSIEPGPLRDWHNVCNGLGNNLRAAGFSHHWHTPHAQHNHWAHLKGDE